MNSSVVQIGADEKIIKVLHRNWFYIAMQYFILILMAGLFFFALIYTPFFFPEAFGLESKKVIMLIENMFLLGLWLYGFLIWIDYYFDIWIITDQRVVNIEQKGLFMRVISELNYRKIQDVTAEEKGFIATVVNYGDVFVQTAGEQERFVFRTISDPYKIKELIMGMTRSSEREGIDELGDLLKEKIDR